MERVVVFVFKTIAITILLITILDTTLMLTDAFLTNSRIQAQASLMIQEIARNNYLSEEAIDIFNGDVAQDTGFKHILNLSKVYTKIEYNADELNIPKNYGEYHDLQIDVELNPVVYFYTGNGGFHGTGIVESNRTISFSYHYAVPCLRYLK